MNNSGSYCRWSWFIRFTTCVVMASLLTACARPKSMQVREGSDPKYEDENVAFRNTYYFRVFDYCADANSSKPAYAKVPRIDSLYRFRMTGKASTIGKKIKFESGTLKSYQIDPFGADITYDKRTGQFRFVSQQEADQRAKREAALADFERLLARYRQLAKEANKDRRETIKAAIQMGVESALAQPEAVAPQENQKAYAAGLATIIKKAVSEEFKVSEAIPTSTLELLRSALDDQLQTFADINPSAMDLEQRPLSDAERQKLRAKLNAVRKTAGILQKHAKQATKEAKKLVDAAAKALGLAQASEDEKAMKAAKDQYREARAEEATAEALNNRAKKEGEKAAALEKQLVGKAVEQAAADAGIVCPGSLTRRRGFQILGPEGWRTFDQDDRLLMAMYSDASPIISVLEDLSKRVLNARSRNEVRLLPIVQERLRTVEAQRALEQISPDAPSEEVVKAVLKAFNQSDSDQEESE